MREILCKAKRKNNGKWIEGYYLKSWACKNGNKYDVHLIHNYELDDGWEIKDVSEYQGYLSIYMTKGDEEWHFDMDAIN